mmetsp:Transcript_20809/g.63673  ORF Transcript_20809/g.63673 Transcript_20809/m.63673 type:complete len:246 (-) Transcript_20809:354-1091(-)
MRSPLRLVISTRRGRSDVPTADPWPTASPAARLPAIALVLEGSSLHVTLKLLRSPSAASLLCFPLKPSPGPRDFRGALGPPCGSARHAVANRPTSAGDEHRVGIGRRETDCAAGEAAADVQGCAKGGPAAAAPIVGSSAELSTHPSESPLHSWIDARHLLHEAEEGILEASPDGLSCRGTPNPRGRGRRIAQSTTISSIVGSGDFLSRFRLTSSSRRICFILPSLFRPPLLCIIRYALDEISRPS